MHQAKMAELTMKAVKCADADLDSLLLELKEYAVGISKAAGVVEGRIRARPKAKAKNTGQVGKPNR